MFPPNQTVQVNEFVTHQRIGVMEMTRRYNESGTSLRQTIRRFDNDPLTPT